MDKYEFDKKLEKLDKILSELGGIQEDMINLGSRLDDAVYDLENLRSDLEAFGDEISEEKENEN